ncbi:adenine deaminase [Priestia megaterium]|uniref:adenine deaminase n=1 Tax=Priestia megaterium TaxID=1404 RepID=UPI00221F4BD0|nr:adenine deaminase [Priestia megaterium]MCZ8497153.1 adenine deaminase [Priestia megaterium]UYV53402.1 adenine deaminase [Priestia megaterium]
MSNTKTTLKKQLAVANKKTLADLVVKNGKIIDVFTLSIIEADIAIADGVIVGIGQYDGNNVVDAKGKYISPTFIDGHVHIESSMVTPKEFSKLLVPRGVTTVVTDPHEIANVSGKSGIEFMLQNSDSIPLDVFVNLPSSVPATPFESSGAVLKAADLAPFFSHSRVLGLAEVMDFPAVRDGDDDMLDKLQAANDANGVIDGHGSGLDATGVNIYRTANISTDHECVTAEEAIERIQRGMYVLIRQGSVAKDLKQLLPAVNERNARRFLFCTDDKHLDDLLTEGSIDYNVRFAIELGLDPLIAIQMASLNAAECYGLKDRGAVAPGYKADFILLDDLTDISAAHVYQNGELIAENGEMLSVQEEQIDLPTELMNSVHLKEFSIKKLTIPLQHNRANIIEINPNSLLTNHIVEEVQVKQNEFQPSVENDQLKMAVVERHHLTGNIGLGIVKGFQLKDGAIATTIAHDSHNIVAVGTNDEDLAKAIAAIEEIGGGIVIIKDNEVIGSLPLSIGGLMSPHPYNEVNSLLKQLHGALHELDISQKFNPLLTLSFLSLPVIPCLKLTDKGLFNVKEFKHIPVQA